MPILKAMLEFFQFLKGRDNEESSGQKTGCLHRPL